jgi:hypothetical protein
LWQDGSIGGDSKISGNWAWNYLELNGTVLARKKTFPPWGRGFWFGGKARKVDRQWTPIDVKMGQRQALRVSAKLVSVAVQNPQLNPGL